ncbi:MAG: peptide ABC transporter substrate-binding protein, partial [bacterium]|nr:peptide ABC transporter substrate-binding protein [bacterium]
GVALLGVGWYHGRTDVRPTVGGTYVEGLLGEPRFVNPLFASANDVDSDLAHLLFSGLFRIDQQGAIAPDLAERFEVASDGKTITVVLRENVRWHDGANLTADDVLFTVHLLQDPNAASPLRGSFRGVTVERVDERTVKFTIDRPLAVFLSALTVGILPEHLWIDTPPAHLPLAELNLRPIGAGPYRFVGLTKDKRGSIRSYTLERYIGTHQSLPFLERIAFRFYLDSDQLIAALNGREIDGIGTLMSIPENALQRRDIVRYPIRLPSATAVFLNQKRNDALHDTVVRRALSRAVDRRALIANVLHGAGEAIGGPPIPSFASVADPPEPDAFDLESAAALLDTAKWVRLDQQTLLATRTSAELRALEEEKKKAGKPAAQRTATDEERKAIEERVRTEVGQGCAGCAELPYHRMRGGVALTIAITAPDVPELVAMAEYIRDQWRTIGVRARVETVPLERVRGEIIPNRSYDTLLFSQILGPDPDPFPFWHSSQVRHPGLNLSYFSSRAIDKLLEEARTTLDREERGKKYATFQKLLAEEHPAVFLTTPTLTYAITNAVRGVHFGQLTAPTDRLNTIADWYTETERVWRR